MRWREYMRMVYDYVIPPRVLNLAAILPWTWSWDPTYTCDASTLACSVPPHICGLCGGTTTTAVQINYGWTTWSTTFSPLTHVYVASLLQLFILCYARLVVRIHDLLRASFIGDEVDRCSRPFLFHLLSPFQITPYVPY